MMRVSTGSLRNRCKAALAAGLAKTRPEVTLDDRGYVTSPEMNLIAGVDLGAFEEDLRQGDGNELEGKFKAAHSSSALAINAFAPFKSDLPLLSRLLECDSDKLSFERKCFHGLIGRRSPNLDVLLEGPGGVVAIESKCLEPLTPHAAHFAPVYATGITDKRRESPWFTEMLALVNEPLRYRWLDAAQLVKHAFGIAHTFSGRSAALLYLYWEPQNAEAFDEFREHRAEVEQFSARVQGSTPSFVAKSYPNLWESWKKTPHSNWLAEHVHRLEIRYGVTA